MANRAIVNVTITTKGRNYITGQRRMQREFPDERMILWTEQLPTYSPPHAENPYAFKAWALKAAQCQHGVDTILWADACIVPGKRPLAELWEHIEKEGYWICNNGYQNYTWTADSAYPDLFPDMFAGGGFTKGSGDSYLDGMISSRLVNKTIQHAVGTSFGLNLQSTIGKAFLDEYLKLAQTDAFKGPWVNANCEEGQRQLEYARKRCIPAQGVAPCGPPDVRGHRHDQTAISVIAWRLGMKLTNAPEWFSYIGGENERTCLIADGNY